MTGEIGHKEGVAPRTSDQIITAWHKHAIGFQSAVKRMLLPMWKGN